MRILIDTNIFINRENYHILPKNLQELLRILNTIGIDIIVHPRSVDEIEKDRNEERKSITLSKIHTYPFLKSPPDPNNDESFIKIAGHPISLNDYVDNALLYAVYKNAVDFLISEDKGIHNKASRLNLDNRVFSSEEALIFFKKALPVEKVAHPPALRRDFAYNLDFADPFFDSLKLRRKKNEEMEFDETRFMTWLDTFNISYDSEVKDKKKIFARRHASGHASQVELKELIEKINPEKIIPIHTTRSNQFDQLFPSKTIHLKYGEGIDI